MKGSKSITRLIQLLFNMGVVHVDSSVDVQRVKGVNFLAFIWVLPLIFSALFCFSTPYWNYGMLMFMSVSILILIPVFNSFGFLKFSITAFFMVINFNLLLVNVLFEFSYESYLLFFPLLAAISYLFPLPEYKRELVLNLILVCCIHGISFVLIYSHPLESLHLIENTFYVINNYIFSFLLTAFIVYKSNTLQALQRTELDEIIKTNEKQKILLTETLKDKNILLSEVHHRTKNNLAIVSSMLNLQRHQIEDEHFRSILLDCSNRIHSMASIHQKLYEHGNFKEIDLKSHLINLIQELKRTVFTSDSEIETVLDLDPIMISVDKAVPIALIVNELVTNSAKHAFPTHKGTIEVKAKIINKQVILIVQDDGVGFSFDATTDYSSLGMTLIEALTEQLDGVFEFRNTNGTSFVLKFSIEKE